MVCVHRTRPISHVIGARPRGTSGRARPTADRGNTRSPRPAPAAPPGRDARQESLKGEGTLVSEKNDKKRRGLKGYNEHRNPQHPFRGREVIP